MITLIPKIIREPIGKLIYYCGGFILFPVLLGNTTRTRVLVVKDNKVLLGKTLISKQRWNTLGGGIKKSETSLQGAIREVEEECGIKIDESQIHETGQENYKGFRANYHLIYFVAKTTNDDFKLSGVEMSDLGWFNLNSLPSNLHPNVNTAINYHKNKGRQA